MPAGPLLPAAACVGVGVREAVGFPQGLPKARGMLAKGRAICCGGVPGGREASPGQEGEGVASAPSWPSSAPGDARFSGKPCPFQ